MTATVSCCRPFQLLAILFAWCLSAAALCGQTNIAISNTTIQPSVKRLGINLGTLTNYDSGQITKNLIVGNPGFEGQIWNSTVRCTYSTATSCTDEDIYSAWPANFWAGATYQFFYGTAAGRSGTVSSSTAAGNGAGVIFNFVDSGTVPQPGDYMIVRLTTPGGSSVGWQTSTYGNGTVSDNLTDLPANTLGKQTIALTAPAATDTAQIQTSFDSTNTISFVQLNGTYQLQFKAKGLGGSNQILVKLARGSSTPYIYQAVNLSNSWNTYNLTFTANETGSAVNTVGLIFSTVYGADSFELDDVSLTQSNSDPSNPTVFRDEVVNTLRTLRPGIIRYWENNGQLGETLDNLLTPQFGRLRAGSSAYLTQSSVVDYGLHEFLVLCQTVGAEPWIVVPTTFSTTDAANLMEYLAGSTTTVYGGKRAALGQTNPWTQVFSKIHLEFGNEAWNSTFQGGTILYNQPYGQQAQTIFSAMQNDSSYSQSIAGIFDFVLGGQAASPGYNQGVQGFCNNNTSFTIAPYTMSSVDSYADNESLFGSTFAEPEALMSSASSSSAEGLSPGEVYQNYVAIQATNHPVPLSFYEINMSTLSGTITQTAVNSYASSLGAGLMVADTMLQGMQQYGVVDQSLFALPQYEVSRVVPPTGPGGTVYLWGAVVDMGNTNRKRPQYLALELANQALSSGAAMLQTAQTGDNPMWNESTMTNSVQFTGAHYIQSYAFQQGTSFSTIVFNLSRSSPLSVTFSGANAPAGTVLMQQLTSTNVTDTNESSNVVGIASSTLTNFSGATGLSLPPYSMTVLNWSTSSQAPVISGVSASAITGTSATISWTTDQGSSSQVNYGTSTGYGSSSPLNTTLSTNHSVTLTGLSQGTTYNFDVVSANSASQSSTSANFTFTTTLPAPVISAVAESGITTTSATITWTTDQASSSQVAYLSTASYSSTTAPSLSASSTLVKGHSITLTGLTASTTYNFTVTSENSAGTPATSSSYSFTTIAAPVISNVVAINVTPTSATITWTTDQAATSQVLYGVTTSYDSASVGSGTLVTAHSVTITGLTQNTTYNFDVLSANTYGLATTSANYMFTTGLQGPTITYVAASAVGNTSVTIGWTTDEASTSQVEYGTTTSYGATSTLNSTLTTTHSVTLTGLTLGTTYDYAVISTNSTGNSSTSGNFSFSTTGGSSTTNIAINSTPIQSTVKRLGITLGTLNNYDSGQMTKNLITQNPGFEGQVWNSIIECSAGTATTCIDQNVYSSWPAGYWSNASYQVISGTASGRSGTVSYSTAAGGGYGITLGFADTGAAPSAGSYLIVRKTVSGGSSGGWQTTTSSGGTVTDNLTDLPTGTTGQQTVALSAPTLSDYATILTSFDTTSGMSFVQLNGNYQLQFKAKALGGSNAIGVVLQRSGGTTFLNQIVNLSNSWNTYNLTFSAAESGAVGSVSLAFNTVYGQDYVELDDVRLTQTSGDPSNSTVFSDAVVNALRTAQPGILRYWGGNGQLGETLDNLLKPQFGRQRAGYSEYAVSSTQIDYGLPEFLVLCQSIGAEPWFVVPSTFSSTDAANLIEYLAGSTATTYGAKRAALGQTTPWTQVFSKIHLEFGEQTSNLTLAGGQISDPASYGAQAQAIFAAMQSDASYAASAGSFDFVLGGPASSAGSITTIQNNCNNNTSFDIAPYTMNTVSSYATNEALFGPTFAEPEALMSSSGTAEGLTPGMVYQDYEAIQQSSHVVPLSFSEINMSTLGGTITQAALNSYVSSLGAGLMVADTMLQGLKQFGVVNQNLYSLPGYSYSGRSDGSAVYLFGSVVDMGVTNRKRPQFLALELANQALSNGATMLQTVHSGFNPTWDQPLSNNVYLSGAHYLQSYAFQNGTSFTTVLFNLSRTTSLPVTFSGANAPTGAVQVQQLTSANPTDTNETSNVVAITSSTMTGFSDTAGLSLPPYSMTVLTWSTSTQAPAISGVIASGISGTSATITWTTDEPSSSQVQYGTTPSYGSSSALISTLSTSHSVTLTGLTPGTTYDFNVTSANSASTTASSANFTFTTSSPAPVISGITVVAVNASTTTISWTTDQASTSVLNYGTTQAYGTIAESTSLVTAHSITLANLVPNTVYDFAVTSANSAGTASTSGNSTFAVGNPPVITNISVISISASSATITWTTDQSTSSLVNYGTTTAYGSTSTVNPAFVTSHSVTLTGLTGGTTYDFDVVSANSVGTYTTSSNGTFTTLSATPAISNVAVSGITSTGATITWTTDQGTTSQVNYGTSMSYGTSTTVNTTLVTSHSVTLTGLTAGTLYDFAVVSANGHGTSATSANSSFTTLASAVPVISNIQLTNLANTSVTITWTTDQTSTSQVNYGTTAAYGSSTTGSATLATNHSVTLTGLTAGTLYDFDVVSANSANVSATSTNSTFTTTGTPVISNVAVSAITNTGATITWTTDQGTTSLVNYGTTQAYGTATALNTTLVTTHSVTLTGLTAGTLYDFDVVSANATGTLATSANSTFTTTAVAAPVISNIQTAITNTGATITWTTDQMSTSLVNYGLTQAYGAATAVNTSLTTSHSVTLTGLTAGTLYDFDVVSANSANASATSANTSFTTSGTPVISNVAVTSITSTGATITWTTDQMSTSLVNYGLTQTYGTATAVSTTLTTSHSVTLTGLTAGTLYDFDVVSANASGTQATSANSAFTTTVAAAPVISNIQVSATNTGATISWTTDQMSTSLLNYGLTPAYGTATPATTTLTTSHSVAITGLTAGTLYDFDVVSANAGNTSATSANSTFTTTGTPLISNVAVSAITSTGATITWTTDQGTTSLVNYGTTGTYGTATPVVTTLATTHTVILTGLTAGTLYDFDVVSANASGTQVTSANGTFTTTAAPAPVISNVQVTPITNTGATITWTTDQSSTSQVNYGLTTAYGSSTTASTTMTTSHSVTLTGLTAGTLYDFDVVSANASGTSATSANKSFTTSGTPAISNVAVVSLTSSGATITWTTDQPTSSLVNYGTTQAYGTATTLNTTLVTNHSVTLTGLTASTMYDFDVVSANASGTPVTSPNSTFTTTAAPAPVISGITVSAISNTGATISWTTDQSSTSLVNYGTTTSYGTSTAVNTTLATSHSVTLTGLSAGTLYDFDVVSANSANTAATSANTMFTTTGTAPAPVISNVTVTTVSTTSETISWTTDQATTSLVKYGTSTSYGSTSTLNTLTTSHSVTLTGLTASTTYNFEIVATTAGGSSTASANYTWPDVGYVAFWGVNNSGVTISWSSDVAGNTLLAYGTTTALGQFTPVQSSLATSHGVVLTGLNSGTTYYFAAESTTATGETAVSTTYSFTTTGTASPAPVISAVTASGITSTSATITWTTDQSSSSQVNYGATTAYGSSSTLNTTLTTSHSVTLTGLTAGTTYSYDVVSANSSGTSSVSTNYTFVTSSGTGAPVISAVTATSASTTSETITWTTDQASSSLVDYGTTASYGSASTLNTSLTTSHSVTLTGLTAGTTYYFAVVSANSASASSTSPNGTFTTAAGTPVISAVTATNVSATSETITWTTDQMTSSLVNYGTSTSYGSSSTLNTTLTTSHSVTLTGLTAGTNYDFDVASANSAGTSANSPNSTFTTPTATGTAPNISYLAYWGINNSGITISWSTDLLANTVLAYGTTPALGQFTPVQSTLAASHGVVLTGLNSGTTYYFVAESTGANGVTGYSTTYSFTTTGTASPSPVISAVTATSITTTSATITWTTDQSSSSLVNYGTSSSYGSSSTLNTTLTASHSVTLTGLTAGTTYNFDVVSANASSISSTSTNYTFSTLVTGGPVISAVTATSLSNTSEMITWTTDVSSTSQVTYGTTTSYGSSSTMNATLTTSHSVTLTGLTAGTLYDFAVVSASSTNVTSTSPNATFTTTSATPVISAVTATNVSGTSETITWTTDQAASSLVNYGTTTGYGSSSTLNTTLTMSHSVTLTGLTAGTTYDFDVVSTNSGGTSATSSNYTFTTPATTATPPYVGYVAYWGINNTGITISWSTDVNSNTVLAYGTTTALGQIYTNTATGQMSTTSHGVVLTGLNPGTTYYFVAESTSTANGATGYSTTYSFTTTGTATSPAPVISAVTAASITSTSATITWTTDQSTSSQVNYGTSTSYGSSSTLNTTLTTSHSVTLTGLTAGTTYNFDVVSANSSSVSSISPNSTFTTSSATGAPVISAVTATSVSNTSETITWTTDQSSSSLVNYGTTTGYGSSSTLSTTLTMTHSVTLTGLTAGTTYNFDVVSANSSNISSTSPNATFTTTSTTATPVISAVTATSVSSTSETITWTTDQSTSSLVNYGASSSYGSSSTLSTSLTTSHSVTLTGLTASTTYNFDVVSTNSGGTSATSANSTFTTAAGSTSGTAPNLSYIAYWGITSSGITISWSTDLASTTQVTYGTSASLGQFTTLQTTLATSHGVVLTGLNSGTTYYFQAQSTTSGGATGYSTTYSFTTLTAGPPTVSGITVTPKTGNTALISWTTSVPTNSYVQYGTTTSYNYYSSQTSLTASPSCTLSYVPSGLIHYQLVSTDSNGNKYASPDYTFTEP